MKLKQMMRMKTFAKVKTSLIFGNIQKNQNFMTKQTKCNR